MQNLTILVPIKDIQDVPFPEPRFIDNDDGTVRDNLTGLIWLKNANCFGTRTWDEAISDCNGLESGQCGLTDGSQAGDWRLPNLKELFSLIDHGMVAPALPSGHPFESVQNLNYWSSTTDVSFTDNAYRIFMLAGYMDSINKSGVFYVWPVRGGH